MCLLTTQAGLVPAPLPFRRCFPPSQLLNVHQARFTSTATPDHTPHLPGHAAFKLPSSSPPNCRRRRRPLAVLAAAARGRAAGCWLACHGLRSGAAGEGMSPGGRPGAGCWRVGAGPNSGTHLTAACSRGVASPCRRAMPDPALQRATSIRAELGDPQAVAKRRSSRAPPTTLRDERMSDRHCRMPTRVGGGWQNFQSSRWRLGPSKTALVLPARLSLAVASLPAQWAVGTPRRPRSASELLSGVRCPAEARQ